jgi:hypothetical protein
MTDESRVNAGQWGLALGAGIALSLLMWHGLLEGSELNGGDTWPYFMPQKAILAESLQQNELPLWHDLTGLGYPLLAESQAGVFYPSNQILYRLFDVNRAYAVSIVVHYALAFTFAWRFIRTQKVSCLSSLLGAMVYVYGWFPARISLEWSIIGGLWLPLTLWLTHEFLEKPSRWKFAALTTALATHLLAGHFTLAFINELCLVCYAIFHLILRTRAGRMQLLTAAAVPCAVLLSLLLSSAQLLPSMELKQISQRDEEQLDRTVRKFDPGYGHMPPLYLTQLVASWSWWHTPEVRHSRQILHLPGSINSDTNAVEAHFYLGLIPLGLVAMSLIPATSRRADPAIKKLWLMMGLASIVYATGWLLPVTRYLPGFTYFMGPGRYTIVATLAGAVLCGTALDGLLRRTPTKVTCLLLIGTVTWIDMQWATRPIADAVEVPAIWPTRRESWIREYFSGQPKRSSRLLASGPNVANMFGVSSVPQYLGIGPAVYFGERLDVATSPEDERFLKPEQIERIRELGVTHLLTDRPVRDREGTVKPVGSGPDMLLNRIWGAGQQPRYLYALQNPGQRLFTDPAAAMSDWNCIASSNHAITFEVTLTEPATVHLRELMYPGWTASIDGTVVQSEHVDDLLRSVEVPAGTHRLEWHFDSASVRTGIWISGLMFCGLWLLPVFPIRRSKKSD